VERLLGSLDPRLRLLHLCGADRREAPHPQGITRVTVYRAAPLEVPNLAVAEGSIALIHSPRAGERFAELIDGRSRIAIAAISDAAAKAAGRGWRTVATASRPTDDALLALAASLCEKPEPK
jgi:uroporphyrinogen-III synthase